MPTKMPPANHNLGSVDVRARRRVVPEPRFHSPRHLDRDVAQGAAEKPNIELRMLALQALGDRPVVGMRGGSSQRARAGIARDGIADDYATRGSSCGAARRHKHGQGPENLFWCVDEASVHTQRGSTIRHQRTSVAR